MRKEKRKYYLIGNTAVIVLERATKSLTDRGQIKKGIIVIQDLKTGLTADIKENKLKEGGFLEDYFKQTDRQEKNLITTL